MRVCGSVPPPCGGQKAWILGQRPSLAVFGTHRDQDYDGRRPALVEYSKFWKAGCKSLSGCIVGVFEEGNLEVVCWVGLVKKLIC